MVFSWYSVAVMLLAFYQSTPKMFSHFRVRNGLFHLLSSGEWTRAQWNHQWISHFWPWIGRRAADDVAVHGWTWDIALRNLGIHQPPSSFFVWGVAPTLLRKNNFIQKVCKDLTFTAWKNDRSGYPHQIWKELVYVLGTCLEGWQTLSWVCNLLGCSLFLPVDFSGQNFSISFSLFEHLCLSPQFLVYTWQIHLAMFYFAATSM